MVSKPVSGLLTIRELGFVLRARLSAPIRDYLEFPDIILTAHDFLEGSGRTNRFTVDRKKRGISLASRAEHPLLSPHIRGNVVARHHIPHALFHSYDFVSVVRATIFQPVRVVGV